MDSSQTRVSGTVTAKSSWNLTGRKCRVTKARDEQSGLLCGETQDKAASPWRGGLPETTGLGVQAQGRLMWGSVGFCSHFPFDFNRSSCPEGGRTQGQVNEQRQRTKRASEGRLLVGKTLKSKATSYEGAMKETVNLVAMKSARTREGLRLKIAISILYLTPKQCEESLCCQMLLTADTS